MDRDFVSNRIPNDNDDLDVIRRDGAVLFLALVELAKKGRAKMAIYSGKQAPTYIKLRKALSIISQIFARSLTQ